MEKLFWSQYLASEHPTLLKNQMMQLAELHRMSSSAMKDIIVRLWPAGPIPSSYFGLVKRLSVYRRCADGLFPCPDALGEDEGRKGGS